MISNMTDQNGFVPFRLRPMISLWQLNRFVSQILSLFSLFEKSCVHALDNVSFDGRRTWYKPPFSTLQFSDFGLHANTDTSVNVQHNDKNNNNNHNNENTSTAKTSLLALVYLWICFCIAHESKSRHSIKHNTWLIHVSRLICWVYDFNIPSRSRTHMWHFTIVELLLLLIFRSFHKSNKRTGENTRIIRENIE